MISPTAVITTGPNDESVVRPTRTLLLCAATLGFGISFFLAENSLRPEVASSAAEVAELVETVSRSRQIGLISVGMIGLLLLGLRGGHRLDFGNVLALTVLALTILCFASTLWADDPAFTVRRLASALLGLMAVLGVSRRFSPRDLCKMVLVITLTYLCVGICVELLGQGYRTDGPRYRFGGTVNPNLQGMYCVLLSLSAACLARGAQSGKWLFRGLFLLGTTFLLLTGSRTSLYSFLVAITAYWLLTTSRPKRALALTWTPTLIATLVLSLSLCGADSSRILGVLLVGRDSGTIATMTNRIPVWNEVIGQIGAHPLLGYGYQSFWHSDRVLEIGAATGWAAQGAHSVYLDTILNVGLIGGTLYVFAIAFAVYRATARCSRTVDIGSDFLFVLLTFGTVHSLAESVCGKPSLFAGMVFWCGLSMLAFHGFPSENACQPSAPEG